MEKLTQVVNELRARQDCSPLTERLALAYRKAQYDAWLKAATPAKSDEQR